MPGVEQDKGKRDEPYQIIGNVKPARPPRQVVLKGVLQEADWSQQFAEETHQNDRPVPGRIAGGAGIAHPVHPDDHSHALPYHRVVRQGHPCPLKQGERKENDEGAPREVVYGGSPQNISHPPRGGIYGFCF